MWSVTVEIGDMWGPLDPQDPHRLQFYCDDPDNMCPWNGSRYQPHVIGVAFPPRFRSIVDPDRDGMADYDGYADRWGMPVQGCDKISLDCVPLVIEHVPLRYSYQGRFDYREYDVLFDRKTSGWLRYPHSASPGSETRIEREGVRRAEPLLPSLPNPHSGRHPPFISSQESQAATPEPRDCDRRERVPTIACGIIPAHGVLLAGVRGWPAQASRRSAAPAKSPGPLAGYPASPTQPRA